MDEYVGLNEYDDSFLPSGFMEDEIILDRSGEPCYSCKKAATFYNVTVGRNECYVHTKARDKELG